MIVLLPVYPGLRRIVRIIRYPSVECVRYDYGRMRVFAHDDPYLATYLQEQGYDEEQVGVLPVEQPPG